MATTSNNNELRKKLSESTTPASSHDILSPSPLQTTTTTITQLPHLLETRASDTEFYRIDQPSYSHSIFADSLRDWKDPFLHGSEPIKIPLCPRCSSCKCRSLLNQPVVNTSTPQLTYQYEDIHHDHQHHHFHHHPSCPSYKSKLYSSADRTRSLSVSTDHTSSHVSSNYLNSDKSMSSLISPRDRTKSLMATTAKSKIPVPSFARGMSKSSEKTNGTFTNRQILDRSTKTLIPRLIINKNISKNQSSGQEKQAEKVTYTNDAKLDINKDTADNSQTDQDR
ncbi:unnamed protein product [Didymodactylos carnosus]|uniref:Uncharacterized protein n=1 Tax=Didymodactylos carnosus TaxID=1234261 RepID=A0A814M9T1_9BILA|nr:unnamed protein product [Didymodactylos carnosus]CAF1075336.1 unnamed protein product [Didymodactylos carnosus]CAF3834486.1 unnamed protein product [Didymodactylos carnosus]CAF3841947.1 unnamed protein product [Didymodactylos carnosus]